MKGYMYILQCADGSYYTGSTNDLELRLTQHQTGEGANQTKKRLPVKLVYYEEYQRIDDAFYREKQVQGWRREKKEALITGEYQLLPELAIAYRDLNTVASSTSATVGASATEENKTQPLPEVLEDSVKEVSSRASETTKTKTIKK
ncbi:MAG TPA: GIY-YIG nuclease family protein [Bacteroidales bacterium]|nr:GIY-YIG nuclease family protein [Bacteroidales bacterium]